MRFFLIDRITRWEVGSRAEGGKVKAAANRGDTLVTSTEMVFAFKHIDDPLLDEKRRRLMDLAAVEIGTVRLAGIQCLQADDHLGH